MSITSRQRPIAYALTDDSTNYVLGSYDTSYDEGLPLNRGSQWRINFDLSASGVDVAFRFEVQGIFEGAWSFLENVVVPAGSIASVQRDARGYALRVNGTIPLAATSTVTVSFEGWSADG